MIGDTAQIAVELKLKDQQFQSSIAKDERSLKSLNATAGKTGGAFKFASDHVGTFSKNMHNAVGNLGKGLSTAAHNIERLAFMGGALAVGGGIAAVKWAGDFEAQLRTINTIARETPEGLSRIGDSIRQIARTTGTPLEELTQGYYDLLSAGIKAADAQNVLTNANKLAIGGLASAAETVDLLTTAINVYGGDARQAGRFTDEFAKAIERGKVTAAELASSYAQVAPLAKSLNIENKELAAGYATLTAAGTPAAEAATQMASAMTALLKTTPGLEKLQKQTKRNYAEIAGSQGLNVALEQMRVDAEKAGIQLVDLVGRKEALLFILQTTGPNLQKYNADLAAMGNAAGTAADQMAERQQGLNFQLSVLKAGIKDAGITIGTALIPKLVPLIASLNEFLSGHQRDIEQFGQSFAGAFEGGVRWLRQIDFGQITTSLKVAGTFAKGLISAFLSAPQWLQTAVVTGWGLNKLTGGAVQNIMADLTKAVIGGALQQFVARGASPANPLFVSDVTGGAGGLAGGKLGFLGTALKVTVIGAVAIAGLETAIALSGINDPRHQLKTPVNRFGGTTFRGTNIPDEQIANLEQGLVQLDKRAADGDKMAAKQAEEVRAEIARLRAKLTDPGSPLVGNFGRNGPMPRALSAIGATLTAMQQQMHWDLLNAIASLKRTNDPAWVAAAIDKALASVKGGAGSATTTKGIVGELKAQLAVAEATGNTDLAAKIRDAIKQIEPFQKGRQWQADQIAAARKVVESNKSTAQKTADLKRIQSDLLSHQRSMAAGIVSGLLDVVAAVKNIRIPGQHAPGRGPTEFDEGPSGSILPPVKRPPGRGPLVGESNLIVKIQTGIKDVNTAQDERLRWGKTPTQVGAA